MQSTTINASIDPSTRLALGAPSSVPGRRDHLLAQAIMAIIAHVAERRNLDDAPFVYPDDIDALTAAFVAGFEPVDQSDRSWGSPEGQESPPRSDRRLLDAQRHPSHVRPDRLRG